MLLRWVCEFVQTVSLLVQTHAALPLVLVLALPSECRYLSAPHRCPRRTEVAAAAAACPLDWAAVRCLGTPVGVAVAVKNYSCRRHWTVQAGFVHSEAVVDAVVDAVADAVAEAAVAVVDGNEVAADWTMIGVYMAHAPHAQACRD